MPAVVPSEETCVGCRLSPLDVSLVLTCSHRLCLDCAARQLQSQGVGSHIAQCPDCGAVTDVDPSAADHLREHRATLADRGIQSSVGGSGTAGRSARTASEDRCGQCSTEKAEVDCLQCGEQFCGRCASAVHRAGRMREHRLVPLAGSAPLAVSMGGSTQPYQKTSSALASPATSTAPSPRQERESRPSISSLSGIGAASNARCPVHPDEPAQFFCIDSETECICAECAVEAAHSGREVMNVRKAYQSLAGHMDRTTEGLRARHEEHTQIMAEAEGLKTDLDSIISKGKKGVHEAFRQLRACLDQKEADLLAGVDSCESAASQTLLTRVQPATVHTDALNEAQMALRKIDARSDEVKALNMFAAAKVTVEHLVDPLTGVDRASISQLIDDLRGELRASLQQQAADVNGLAARVTEIRRSGGPQSNYQAVRS